MGEALLHLGQTEEAWPRLERALCQAMAHDHPALAMRIELSLAEGRLHRGLAPLALERLDTCLADVAARPDMHLPLPQQLRLQRCLGRAAQALGLRDRAQRHQAEAGRLQHAAEYAPVGPSFAPGTA